MLEEKKAVKIGLGSFDLIKGLAILFVIIGHAYRSHPVGDTYQFETVGLAIVSLIRGFMPMFFIISGYGFRKKTGIKMLKKSFSELVIPYLIAVPVAIVFHFVLCWKLYISKLHCLEATFKMAISFLIGTDSAGPLWFFLALFIATNILNLILNEKRESVQFALVGLCVIVGFALMHCEFRYFRIIEGLTAVGFCYIGYFLKVKKLMVKAMNSIWTYIILIPMWILQTLGMTFGGAGFDMAKAEYTCWEYVFAGGIGLLLMFVGLRLNQIKWEWFEFFRKCGMYSYWILIVHTVDFIAFPWYDLWASNPSALLAFAVELGLRILIITMGCEIMKKITQSKYRIEQSKNKKI